MKLSMESLKGVVIHPFFIAAIIVVAALQQVKQLVLPEEVLPSFFLLEGITAVILLITSLLMRSVDKGGVLTTLFLLLFFSYRLIITAIDYAWATISGAPPSPLADLIVYSVMVFAVLASTMKTKWNFGKWAFELDHKRFSSALNIVSAIILVMNSVPLAAFELKDVDTTRKFVQLFNTAYDGVKLDASAGKPDIYYFIVDGFASRKTMKDMFHCDDDRLYKFLTEKGFYVVPDAASNYDRTEISLSSALNMQYINAVPDQLGKDYDGLNLFCRLIQEGAVMHKLRQLGYKFVVVSSGAAPTDYVYQADVNLSAVPLNNFVMALIYLTPMFATEKYVPVVRDLLAALKLAPDSCIPRLANIPGPKFVIIHTMVTHAPNIFDKDGKLLPLPEGHYMIDWGTPAQLTAQWQFAQTKVIEWTNRLLQQTDGKAVIIVQSDHGSGIAMANPDDWFNERMRNLNAYYLPGKKNEGLYPTITPVNSFRVVLNDYFKANLPMLKDEVWCSPDYAKVFYWSEVKNKLKFDPLPTHAKANSEPEK